MQKSKYPVSQSRARSNRVLLCVVLLLLVMQLLATAFHRHASLEPDVVCASCDFAHHLPPAPPGLAPDLAPTLVLLGWFLLLPGFHRIFAQASYLIPHAHAPPPLLSRVP